MVVAVNDVRCSTDVVQIIDHRHRGGQQFTRDLPQVRAVGDWAMPTPQQGQGQIAHNKIPRYVEFVDEFPMTVTGKIQKFLMREAVEARLGLKAAKTA